MLVGSSGHSWKLAAAVLFVYHSLIALFAVPVSFIFLANGYFSATLAFIIGLASAAIAIGIVWYTIRSHFYSGRLFVPDRSKSEVAILRLSSRWQGRVDLEAVWMVPQPPSNELRLPDEAGQIGKISLPSVGGDMSKTEIEIPLPDMPDPVLKRCADRVGALRNDRRAQLQRLVFDRRRRVGFLKQLSR